MRNLALLSFFLNACAFNPSIDGTPLVGCAIDDDCPRNGICVGGYCVSQPLAITSIFADPEVVEAGQECALEVQVVHSRLANKLEYEWRQLLGPRTGLKGQGTSRIVLTTEAGYVGRYAVEVTVRNGSDPPQTAQVHCAAIDVEEAAFIVTGHDGDCSRELPCGSVSTAQDLDPVPRRYYLGVEEGSDEVWYYRLNLDNRFDDREIHGGYVFPGWKRDTERARVALNEWERGLDVRCRNCILSGIRVRADMTYDADAVGLSYDGVTLRDFDIIINGGREDSDLYGIGADWSWTINDMHLEGITIRVGTGGLVANRVTGVELCGQNSTMVDTRVDLSGATAETKYGLVISGNSGSPAAPFVDRVRITTGPAEQETRGMIVNCAAPTVWNTIIDAQGTGSNGSMGLLVSPSSSSCPDGALFHSSIFIAGTTSADRAVRLMNGPGSMSFINCILDAGDDGWSRWVVDIEQDTLQSQFIYDFSGSVLVLNGGKQARDDWGRHGNTNLDLAELETLLDCEGCLSTATNVAHVDREGGDFHLTAESTCCCTTGANLDDNAPDRDFDGKARPAAGPAVGPYQCPDGP